MEQPNCNMNLNMLMIQKQLAKKINCNQPFYPTRRDVESVETDMDHFPYKRFYRGNASSDRPHIMEREAGFKAQNNNCYKVNTVPVVSKYDFCWEYPCSGIKPCSKAIGKCNHFVVAP